MLEGCKSFGAKGGAKEMLLERHEYHLKKNKKKKKEIEKLMNRILSSSLEDDSLHFYFILICIL